jgi:hypothetical protein
MVTRTDERTLAARRGELRQHFPLKRLAATILRSRELPGIEESELVRGAMIETAAPSTSPTFPRVSSPM